MRIGLAIATLLIVSPALAEPKCTEEPQNNWLSKEAMIKKIKAADYSIGVFRITSGRCYELYGRDTNGQRVGVYFSPMAGETVRSRSHWKLASSSRPIPNQS